MYQSLGKLLLRRPLFSFNVLFDNEGQTKSLNELIQKYISDNEFLEALYWASPQLYKAAIAYGKDNNKSDDKLLNTLKKYIIRSCTRSTPYGIFAGCAALQIDDKNTETQRFRRVRVDSMMLLKLIEKLNFDESIWPHLNYTLNSSVYKIEKQFRYLESSMDDKGINYKITSIDSSPLINKIARKTQDSYISVSNLFSSLGDGLNKEDFINFMHELIKSQLLVSELQQGVTVVDPLFKIETILNKLLNQNITGVSPYLVIIHQIKKIIALFEKSVIGDVPMSEITCLEQLLLAQEIHLDNGHFFHADLRTSVPANFHIPNSLVCDITEAIPILDTLTTENSSIEDELKLFKNAYIEKYEYAEMQLAEVLDPEFGIGFPIVNKFGYAESNLLFNTSIPEKIKKKESSLLEKIEQSFFTDIETIDLSKEKYDLGKIKSNLANGIAVFGTHLSSGEVYIQSIGGAHANMLTARFSYLDEQIKELCTSIVTNDILDNRDAVLAEIIHLPEGRVANVLRHEPFYEFEIPYLSSSSVFQKNQLPIDDLMISLQENEIIIRSKKLNRRVIPRLSNAHNFINSKIPVYKFLACIQHQGRSGLEVSLVQSLSDNRYIPRVQYKKIIFSRATWFLYRKEIEEINQSLVPTETLRIYLTHWKVPRFICVCEGDNELFLDSNNEEYLRILINEIKKSPAIIKLTEWLDVLLPQNKNNDQFFQFILPLRKSNNIPSSTRKFPKLKKSIKRVFTPGDEWIYLKVYCNASFSDKILQTVLYPAFKHLFKDKMISKFFFVRFTDPHHHLRFRLHLTDKRHFGDAILLIQKVLMTYVENRLVWKVQLETYVREIERYGQDAIVVSENVFHVDSLSYLQMLKLKWFPDDEFMRFLSGIKNVHYWFNTFELGTNERIEFCNQMCDSFFIEFGNTVKKEIDLKYRNWKCNAIEFLTSKQCTTQLLQREKKLRSLSPPASNLDKYIHMSTNRWFTTQQRLMEYAIYLFLYKMYKQAAYQKQSY